MTLAPTQASLIGALAVANLSLPLLPCARQGELRPGACTQRSRKPETEPGLRLGWILWGSDSVHEKGSLELSVSRLSSSVFLRETFASLEPFALHVRKVFI